MVKTVAALKSMTGFGRATLSSNRGYFVAEVQTLNRRYLELHLNLPRELNRFEVDLRRTIAEQIGRGQVNISLTWRREGKQPVAFTPNIPLAKGLKKAWDKVAKEVGCKEQGDLRILALYKDDLLICEEVEEYSDELRSLLQQAVSQALSQCTLMREKEGKTLAVDLEKRGEYLREELSAIEKRAPKQMETYRARLAQKLKELFTGTPQDEERLLKEAAIYADRVDITEEIVRFKSHIDHFDSLLRSPLESGIETRGKKLDFLLQELLREINTMGAKAADAKITRHVVNVKGELEKMREQVQNIE